MLIKRNKYPASKSIIKKYSKLLNKVLISEKFINSNNVKNFEKKFSQAHKTKRLSVAFSSASTAISSFIDCVCNKKINYEIIIPAFSPIPVLMSIVNFGYKVKFVDIDPNTFLIDLEKLSKEINKNTKIIMPVHLFGNVVDIKKIKKIIKKKKIFILEDTSQAHFSKIEKNFAGLEGDAAVFSFYPTKNLWALGDAGALILKNKNQATFLKSYRNYGLHPFKNKFLNFGNNFRMDELQASILDLNLKLINKININKNKNANIYKKFLKGLPLKFQKINSNIKSNFHVFAIIVDDKIRDQLFNFLISNNIEAIRYYEDILPQIYYKKFSIHKIIKKFPNSYKISKSIICLPNSAYLKKKEIEYVCEKIKYFFKND